MGQGPFKVVPNEDTYVQFVLYEPDGSDLNASATLAVGDFKYVEDGGTLANVVNFPTNEGGGCYRVLVDSLMVTNPGTKTTILCRDQTATDDWLATSIDIEVMELAEVASKYYSGPEGPGIWVDTTAGAAGTVLGTNGTEDNPCSTLANAMTLATELDVRRLYITGGSSVTLVATREEYEFIGIGEFTANSLNLGSEDVDRSHFKNLSISGTQGGTGRAQFTHCLISAVTSLHGALFQCGLTGTTTLSSNDDHVLDQCFSMVAGGGTPAITLGANIDLSMRHYSGGIQFNSGGNTNSVSLEGHGQFVIDASCTNFTLNVRGAFKETDNGTNTTIENEASFNRIAASTDANLISIDGVSLAAHESGRVPVPAIGQYGDAVWYDSASGSTGTTIGTNGHPGAPVNVFADAITLAGSTGLEKIYAVSDVTLASNPGELEIIGLSKTTGGRVTITGGSQNSLDTTYRNVGLEGTFGAVSNIRLFEGQVSGTVPLVSGHTVAIAGTWTPNVAGTLTLNGVTTFSTTSTVDMTTNSVFLELLEFAGEITLTNMDATNTALVVGVGKLTIDGTCTGGTVTARGQITVTDNSGGAVTVVQDTGTNLTQIDGEADRVDKLARILDSTIDTTITSGGGSTTTWSASGIPTTSDDQLIDKTGVFVDGNAQLRGFVVIDYDNSTKTLTVDTLNVAPSDGDRFLIFA